MRVPDQDAGNPARAVRDEDAFDAAAVSQWLGRTDLPQVRQFAGGASNLTYLLSYPDRDLILRRPPAGRKAKGAHDMGREFRVQTALAPVFDLVPTMVGHCADESVIGSEFYVMEKVEGTILRKDLPEDLDLTPDATGELCRNAIDVLVSLHRVDTTRPDLAAFGKGEGYVERQVTGWSRRFADAHTPDVPDHVAVRDWLAANRPDDVATCVIHNDFRFDNLVLDTAGREAGSAPRIVGVLDWEMATLGDPLMDLGGALAYWVEPGDDEFMQAFRRQPTTAPGMWTRAEVVEHYCAAMGFSVTPEQWRFYEVFGLFRLAVIAQQIHYRFFHGQTTNPAFAAFGPAVAQLERRCLEVIG